MDIIFFDKDHKQIDFTENDVYLHKEQSDTWDVYFITKRWYRENIIYQLVFDDDEDNNDSIYAIEYKIDFDGDGIPFLTEVETFFFDEFPKLFYTDLKIGSDGSIEITLKNQELILESINEYISRPEINSRQNIEISFDEYDNEIVKVLMKVMKQFNIEKYCHKGDICTYNIKNDNGIFYIEEWILPYDTVNFKIEY